MPTIHLKIKESVFLPVYQPYIYDYSNRYNVYWGGRGSGKTKFLVQKLMIKGLTEQRNILLMNKFTNKVVDGVWKELNIIIEEFGLTPYFSFNKSEYRATCKINGTVFRCMGLEDGERIKGYADISDVLLDEATNFTLEDFELIDGTIRSPKYQLPLQIYVSFNPVSKASWVFKYFGFDTGIVPPHTFILKTTYLDNIYLDASYHERMEALKLRDISRWKKEALGEFVSLDKLVFQNWRREEFNHAEIEGKLAIGLDFGFVNDISALVASVIDEKNKRIYIFNEWGATNKTNDELAAIITSLGFAKSTIIADSAEQKSVEEIRRKGITRIKPCTKGADSIIHGIQRLQQYEIIVHPSCDGIITEFENYSWQKDKKTNEYINKPIDNFNHYIDALRYSLQCLDVKKGKVLSKSLLGL